MDEDVARVWVAMHEAGGRRNEKHTVTEYCKLVNENLSRPSCPSFCPFVTHLDTANKKSEARILFHWIGIFNRRGRVLDLSFLPVHEYHSGVNVSQHVGDIFDGNVAVLHVFEIVHLSSGTIFHREHAIRGHVPMNARDFEEWNVF